jgi:hypothetical protein
MAVRATAVSVQVPRQLRRSSTMPRLSLSRVLVASGLLATCAQLLLAAAVAAGSGGADWPLR